MSGGQDSSENPQRLSLLMSVGRLLSRSSLPSLGVHEGIGPASQ